MGAFFRGLFDAGEDGIDYTGTVMTIKELVEQLKETHYPTVVVTEKLEEIFQDPRNDNFVEEYILVINEIIDYLTAKGTELNFNVLEGIDYNSRNQFLRKVLEKLQSIEL